MNVKAEVSLYPLRIDTMEGPVKRFCATLDHKELEVQTGPMSTIVAGDCKRVFDELQRAFSDVARDYDVVMTAKFSNACPDLIEKNSPDLSPG